MLQRSVSLSLSALALVGLALVPANAQTTFSNTNNIAIPQLGIANPYPSTINVTGLTGAVTKITVTLTGFSHTFPNDLGAIVVGPSGAKTALFNGPGDGDPVTNLNWTFDDAAAAPLSDGDPLTSGTFQPSNYYPGDSFSAPAPAGPYATNFTAFNGTDPNGVYSLFVEDFADGDSGSISGGWSITITTSPVPAPSSLAVLAVPGLIGMGAMLRRRRR